MANAIFCGSMRTGGNSDFVSRILLENLGSGEIYPIAQQNILGCISCGYCDEHPGTCSLSIAKKDKADFFFQKLFSAEKVFFVSPIYFYSVPSQFKAFLDRAQTWFNVPKNLRPGKGRTCGIVLLGAREQGDKLFEGASFTFKYVLDALGYQYIDPLCLYGLDKKDDLMRKSELHSQIAEYAQSYKP
jgi:multimeric flavodoxin WrbA